MLAGSRERVWSEFIRDPHGAAEGIMKTGKRGITGSDQAWITKTLGMGEARYGEADGVYSFRGLRGGKLPGGAKIVFFYGEHSPWRRETMEMFPWTREHYNGPNFNP